MFRRPMEDLARLCVWLVSIRQADLRCFEGKRLSDLGLVERVSIRQADLRCFEASWRVRIGAGGLWFQSAKRI